MKDNRGTWLQALSSLAGAILLILAIRWALFEPYVIPSGSMVPTLLIHDHILVNKFAYGLRVPFSTRWLLTFSEPARGDVIVFRSVDDASVFVVKRVIGKSGDQIQLLKDGSIHINGEPIPRRQLSQDEVMNRLKDWSEPMRIEALDRYDFFEETLGDQRFLTIRDKDTFDWLPMEYQVPERSYFLMGDNRDNSADSRVWGMLGLERVLGRASWVWLSCEETLPEANQVCDPNTIRWNRIFEGIR